MRLRFPSLMLAAVMLVQSSAFAQTRTKTVREELPPAAVKDWDAAKALFEDANYSGALTEFLRAYELSKNPRVLFNVGVCERQLQHYARAAARFRQELSEGSGILTPDEVVELSKVIAQLEPFIGSVNVTSNEAGAKVYVDGEEAGVLPLKEPIRVDVGTRSIRVAKSGFADNTQTIAISTGAISTLDAPLSSLVKKSTVRVEVSGTKSALVYIDGVEMGPAPYRATTTPGRHNFEGRAPGFRPTAKMVEVIEGDTQIVSIAMLQSAGTVVVKSDNADGATVEIDGGIVGLTPWEGSLAPGSHSVLVRKTGLEPYSTSISVVDGQTQIVSAGLTAKKSKTWIWVAIGAAAAVGAGAAITFIAAKPGDPPDVKGNLPPGTVKTSGWAF
ncbi:MAG: PEGA domain-containing protein [Polyangiaceae bacterium]